MICDRLPDIVPYRTGFINRQDEDGKAVFYYSDNYY